MTNRIDPKTGLVVLWEGSGWWKDEAKPRPAAVKSSFKVDPAKLAKAQADRDAVLKMIGA